ncbi:hypothetical protein U1Q18_027267 [Sarracenia purpurea var. burkii]
MVSKVEKAMKKRQQEEQQQHHHRHHRHFQTQIPIQYCHKEKARKFKRIGTCLEEDGVSSAILLLACLAFTPSST